MEETISVSDFAQRIGVKGNEVIKKLWGLGMMGVNINHDIDFDTASLVSGEFGYQVESIAFKEEEVISEEVKDDPADLKPRAPVITIMGHVDHGKTSLLDAIRKSDVAAGEAGGITQHIGAYKVRGEAGEVVFLDTPGHEAFTAMRARGAQLTDIVVLVVAADDGPMPQTIEAINHAKAAEVPIIIAVNKIDRPDANPTQIRQRLMEHELVPEEFGGDHIFVDVSAITKQGVDKLLEMLALQSELLELKANPSRSGIGHIVEARLDRNRGPVATLLVEAGTLKSGDIVVSGEATGKVRAMHNDKGQQISEAGPSTPVEILGLDGVPEAGEAFNVVKDDRTAKQVVEHRREQRKKKSSAVSARVSLENIMDRIKEGDVKEVKIILKADVQGSSEALAASLEQLSTVEVGVKVISSGVGGITETDVTLAKASSAIILGFNVRPAGKAARLAEQEGVDIKIYRVIYDALDDVKAAMEGMLEPVLREKVLGHAEIRQTFTIPKVGTIGGCMVLDGKITRKESSAAGSGFHRNLHRQVGFHASLQRRRQRGRKGLRMWSWHRGLPRHQGRRHHRSLRDGRNRCQAWRQPWPGSARTNGERRPDSGDVSHPRKPVFKRPAIGGAKVKRQDSAAVHRVGGRSWFSRDLATGPSWCRSRGRGESVG